MPELTAKVGHDIVTTSGDTLLGADDKAGVAEVMAAVAYLAAHPDLPRPTIRVGFTPDEEVGEGAKIFDLDAFGADCAYTLDGSEAGEFTDETFTAAAADVRIRGVDVHPGFATGKLVNATRLAGRDPRAAARRADAGGDGGPRRLHPRLRGRGLRGGGDDPHDRARLRRRPARGARRAAAEGRRGRRRDRAACRRRGRRRAAVPEHAHLPGRAARGLVRGGGALRREGFEPRRVPIRGGTDGSILSARGLPTPNLFTGGHEFHSVREWASAQDMASAAAVAVRLAGVWAERG